SDPPQLSRSRLLGRLVCGKGISQHVHSPSRPSIDGATYCPSIFSGSPAVPHPQYNRIHVPFLASRCDGRSARATVVRLNRGAKFCAYELLHASGAGGMREVYKARDTRLTRTVALKVLPAAYAADNERRLRFEREARAISSLNHPHICALYDIGSQDGVPFLVMEYLEGETLEDRLRQGPLPL